MPAPTRSDSAVRPLALPRAGRPCWRAFDLRGCACGCMRGSMRHRIATCTDASGHQSVAAGIGVRRLLV